MKSNVLIDRIYFARKNMCFDHKKRKREKKREKKLRNE